MDESGFILLYKSMVRPHLRTVSQSYNSQLLLFYLSWTG